MEHNMNRFVSFLSHGKTWSDPCKAYNEYATRLKLPTMTQDEASKYTDELSRQFNQEKKLAEETGTPSTWVHYSAIAKLRSFAAIARRSKSWSPRKPWAAPEHAFSSDDSLSDTDVDDDDDDESPMPLDPPEPESDSESDVEDLPPTPKRRREDPVPKPRAAKRHKPLGAFTEPAIHILVGVESMLKNADAEDELQRVRVEEAVRRCQEAIAAIERLSDSKDENDLM